MPNLQAGLEAGQSSSSARFLTPELNLAAFEVDCRVATGNGFTMLVGKFADGLALVLADEAFRGAELHCMRIVSKEDNLVDLHRHGSHPGITSLAQQVVLPAVMGCFDCGQPGGLVMPPACGLLDLL